MADVQLENGFTRVANQILEEISKCKFNGTEFRIIMTVWRYTYGYQRKDHNLSAGFIAESLQVDTSRVKKSLKRLIDLNIILVTEQATYSQSRKLSFNKNFEEWNVEKDQWGSKQPQGYKNTPHEGLKNTPQEGSKNTPNKDKKDMKDISSSGETDFAEVIQFYQSNLQKGISESPFNHELIQQFFDEWGKELLLAAMKVAAKQEAKGMSFVEGVLRNWREQGVQTIEEARKIEQEFRNNKLNKRPNNVTHIKQKQSRAESQYDNYDYGF